MNDLTFWLYMAGFASGANEFVCFLAVLSFFGMIPMVLMWFAIRFAKDSPWTYEDEEDSLTPKWVKRNNERAKKARNISGWVGGISTFCFFLFSTITILIPDQETMIQMIISEAGEELIKLDATKDLYQDLQDLIERAKQ